MWYLDGDDPRIDEAIDRAIEANYERRIAIAEMQAFEPTKGEQEMIHETITIPVPCGWCETVSHVTVDRHHHKAWLAGGLAQDAMPDLTVENREILISTTCASCQEGMFADWDEWDEGGVMLENFVTHWEGEEE